MKAVVLAGGPGKGLSRISDGSPKTLLKIAGKTVIEYVLEYVLEAGIKEVIIVADKPDLFTYLRDRYPSLNISIRKQEGKEVIGAILTAKDELSKRSLLIYGDTLAPSDIVKVVIDAFYSFGCPVLTVVPEMDVRLYGAVKIGSRRFVTEFIEKPKEHLKGYYAFGGISILNKGIIDLIEKENSLDRAINAYIKRGGKIVASIWSGWWVDIGYPWDLLEAIYYILNKNERALISSKAKIASTAIIEGPVIISEGAEIDHYAIIKGPAYIGKNVFIGVNTFIRPYTSIEENSVISSYAEVTWSYIGESVTIGRESFLGYSVVGRYAVIEPLVFTKLLPAEPDKVGIRTIKEYKRRREYHKIGSFIGARARVKSLTALEPGTFI